MKFNIIIKDSITNEIERYIIRKLDSKPYLSYTKINYNDLQPIIQKVYKKFNIHISANLIASIKSNFMKNHIINNYKNIFKFAKKIINTYPNNDILTMSTKFDLSPITILRFVFLHKYNKKLNQINIQELNTYDQTQYKLAIENDAYSQLDQTNIQIDAENFERNIEKILIKHNIQYKTQKQLTSEQINKYGKAINTPDFVIISDLFVNGIKINWIDAKNFFGSNNKFIISKIDKQIQKYITTYGSGSIIFNLGFNQDLHFNNVLLLSYKSIDI